MMFEPPSLDATHRRQALEGEVSKSAAVDVGPHQVVGELLVDQGLEAKPASIGRGSWVFASKLVSQGAQFLLILLAAHFLSPAEFGVFALLSAVSVGITRISEAGWREFIMSSAEEDALRQANTLALFCGIGALVIGLAVAAAFSIYGLGRAVAASMALMSVWALCTTVTAAQAGILVRRGSLRTLARIQIAAEVVGLVTGALTFVVGGGLLGLAVGRLASQILSLGGSLLASRWFPIVRPVGRNGRDAFVFSRQILATRLLSYMQDNAALFAVGAIVGPGGAGLFRGAGRLAGALRDLLAEPVRLLAWSMMQEKNAGVAVDRLTQLTILLATPFFAGLAMTSETTVAVLLGPEWHDAAPLLAAFAIAGCLSIPNVATEPLLAAAGRVDLVPKISLASTLLMLTTLVALAPLGIEWVAIGEVIASLVILPANLWIQHRFGGTSPKRFLTALGPALAATAVLVVAIIVTRWSIGALEPAIVKLAAEVAVGAAAYGAVAFLLAPKELLTGASRRRDEPPSFA